MLLFLPKKKNETPCFACVDYYVAISPIRFFWKPQNYNIRYTRSFCFMHPLLKKNYVVLNSKDEVEFVQYPTSRTTSTGKDKRNLFGAPYNIIIIIPPFICKSWSTTLKHWIFLPHSATVSAVLQVHPRSLRMRIQLLLLSIQLMRSQKVLKIT